MSRCVISSLLALGLVGAPAFNTVAHAAGSADTLATAKHAIATKASIQTLLDKGQLEDAEAGYLEWVNAWQEENPDLLVTVESQLLLKQYTGGNKDAFLALVQAGDPDALKTFRNSLKNNSTSGFSADQLIAAIRAFGTHVTSADLPVLLPLLENSNPAIVNAAIETIGKTGNQDATKQLYIMAGDADLNRSITIAQAVRSLGANDQLAYRYESQLKFPLVGMPERAAVLLSISGNDKGWLILKKMLDDKSSEYYPQALRVLGNLPSSEAAGYVRSALSGNEQEQLAALQSINALPQAEADATLVNLVKKSETPLNVRLAAMSQLAVRPSEAAANCLISFATDTSIPGKARAIAILALQQRGLLADNGLRGSVRMLLVSDDVDVATATRAALLAYAQSVQTTTATTIIPEVPAAQ